MPIQDPMVTSDRLSDSEGISFLQRRVLQMRAIGYGIVLAVTAVGIPAASDPRPWVLAGLLAAGLTASGHPRMSRPLRLCVGLIADAVVALGLWWVFGPSSGVSFILSYVVAAGALLLPKRTSVLVAIAALVAEAAQIPLHFMAKSFTLPLFHSTTDVQSDLAFVGGVTVRFLLLAAMAIFFTQIAFLLRRSQKETARSREQYRRLVESTPDGIVVHQHGTIRYVNPAAAQLIGATTPEKLVGLSVLDLVHPDYHNLAVERIQHAEQTGQATSVAEEKLVRLDGTVVDVEVKGIPIIFDDDQAMLVLVRDITERRHLEEERERFVSFIENSTDFIAMADMSGQMLYVNEAGRHQVGLNGNQEVEEKSIRDFHPESEHPTLETVMQTLLSEGEWEGEISLQNFKTGHTRTYGFRDFLIRDPNTTEPVAVGGIGRDLTPIKEANRRLEELIRSKDQFVASVGHELRTPLTAVLGFAELLRDSDATDIPPRERRQLLASIAREASDLAGLVDDLLVAARAEVGQLNVIAVPVDLRAQTAQVLESLGEQAEHINVTGPQVHALADPARVRQILRNLINNAIRHGGDNTQITITSTNKTASVRVCDNGPGIPDNIQDQIFQPYYTTRTYDTRTGSLGLGLNVSQQLAELMKGNLTYQYQNQESIFDLTLPITPAPESDHKHTRSHEPNPPSAQPKSD